MDIIAQHNFTLGRVWTAFRAELSKKFPSKAGLGSSQTAESTWLQKPIGCLDRMRQFLYFDEEVRAQNTMTATTQQAYGDPSETGLQKLEPSPRAFSLSFGLGLGTSLASSPKWASPCDVMKASLNSPVTANTTASNTGPETTSDVAIARDPPANPQSTIAQSLKGIDMAKSLQGYSPIEIDDFYADVSDSTLEECYIKSDDPKDQLSSPSNVSSGATTYINSPARNLLPLALEFKTDELAEDGTTLVEPQVNHHVKEHNDDAQSPVSDSLSEKHQNEAREEVRLEVRKEYHAELQAELQNLTKIHQQKIEIVEKACATETNKIVARELDLENIAKDLAEKDQLLSMQDELLKLKAQQVKEKDETIEEKALALREKDELLEAKTRALEEMNENIQYEKETEQSIRQELQNAVNQQYGLIQQYNELASQNQDLLNRNNDLGMWLRVAKKEVKEGHDSVTKLRTELKRQATVINETADFLRADDMKSAFLDRVQKHSEEVISLEANARSRVEELQDLNIWRRAFETNHKLIKKNAVVQIQYAQKLADDEINRLQNILAGVNDRINRLETHNKNLNAENGTLLLDRDSLRREIKGRDTKVKALETQVNTFAAHLENAIADINNEQEWYQTVAAEYDADMDAMNAQLENLDAQLQDARAAADRKEEQCRVLTVESERALSRCQNVEDHLKERIATLENQVSILEDDPNKEIEYKKDLQLASTTSSGPNGNKGPDVEDQGAAITGSKVILHTTPAPMSDPFTWKDVTTAHMIGLTPQVPIDLNFGAAFGAKPFAFTAGDSSKKPRPVLPRLQLCGEIYTETKEKEQELKAATPVNSKLTAASVAKPSAFTAGDSSPNKPRVALPEIEELKGCKDEEKEVRQKFSGTSTVELDFGATSISKTFMFTAGCPSLENTPLALPKGEEHGAFSNEKKMEETTWHGICVPGRQPSFMPDAQIDIADRAEGGDAASPTGIADSPHTVIPESGPPKPRMTKAQRREAAIKAQAEAEKLATQRKEASRLSRKEQRLKLKALLKESRKH